MASARLLAPPGSWLAPIEQEGRLRLGVFAGAPSPRGTPRRGGGLRRPGAWRRRTTALGGCRSLLGPRHGARLGRGGRARLPRQPGVELDDGGLAGEAVLIQLRGV